MYYCKKCKDVFDKYYSPKRGYRTKCGLILCDCCYLMHINGKCETCSIDSDFELGKKIPIIINNLKEIYLG